MTTSSASNRDLLTAAITQFDNVLRAAPASSAHKPTPCPDYDVTELIAHVAAVVDRLAQTLGTPQTGQDGDPDWASARDQALQAIATAHPGKTVALPFGTMAARAAYGVLLGELTTHGWDLAVAIHLSGPARPDPRRDSRFSRFGAHT
jgi:uncharacterized protein (TIGR03086 family)